MNKNVLHSILNNIYRLWTVYNDTENTESVDCAGRRVLPYQEVSYDLETLTFQDPRTLRKIKQKRYISQNKIPCDFLRMILRVAVALLTRKTQCISVYGTICRYTLPETNTAPENRPSQKETWGYVSFREGSFFNWLFDSTQKQKKRPRIWKASHNPSEAGKHTRGMILSVVQAPDHRPK